MGFLDLLTEGKKQNEIRPSDRKANPQGEIPASRAPGSPASPPPGADAPGIAGPAAERPATTTPAVPCPTCGAAIFWWDIYGGGPHCHHCRDWPAESMVRRIAFAVDDRWVDSRDIGRAGRAGHAGRTDRGTGLPDTGGVEADRGGRDDAARWLTFHDAETGRTAHLAEAEARRIGVGPGRRFADPWLWDAKCVSEWRE